MVVSFSNVILYDLSVNVRLCENFFVKLSCCVVLIMFVIFMLDRMWIVIVFSEFFIVEVMVIDL